MGWKEKLSCSGLYCKQRQPLHVTVSIVCNKFVNTNTNIALEISTNTASSTDRGEGTSDFKTLTEFYQ